MSFHDLTSIPHCPFLIIFHKFFLDHDYPLGRFLRNKLPITVAADRGAVTPVVCPPMRIPENIPCVQVRSDAALLIGQSLLIIITAFLNIHQPAEAVAFQRDQRTSSFFGHDIWK